MGVVSEMSFRLGNRWRHFRMDLGENSRTPFEMLVCWLWNSRWDYHGQANCQFWFNLKTKLYYWLMRFE